MQQINYKSESIALIVAFLVGIFVWLLNLNLPGLGSLGFEYLLLRKLIIVIFVYCLARLVLLFIFEILQKNIVSLSFILFLASFNAFLYANIYAKSEAIRIRFQIISEQPEAIGNMIHLQAVVFDVTIDCKGDAYIVRNQTLIPLDDINVIPEVGYHSSGGFDESNFEIDIFEINEDESKTYIPNTVSSFDKHSTRLVNQITDSYLKKGRKYERLTKVDAPGAFTDLVGDAFIVLIEYPTNQAYIKIHFENGCKYNKQTLRVEGWQDRVVPLDPPEFLPLIANTGTEIVVFIENPDIGDRYGIIWEYLISPKID